MQCPWKGQECPGLDNCMPAALSPKRDEQGELKPFCPIVAGLEALEYVAMVVAPILESAGIVKKPLDPEKNRDEWLAAKVKPDQEL